ncbi:MAG: hypothetical protein OIN89_03390 [Candidatus Methanoperedens sp.]|jgi:hypothetical protein|nr:hypothetical protein [Candidatus Methanoperedens sp.]PKL54150.1 MAG: hypothetical protein CVV36_03315 [Candidatus Methanoperedenaceae archaeon HGW-Methanoperedenaceae-1]
MVFNPGAIHDVNTGIILTTLVIAYLKSRTGKVHEKIGLLALAVFLLSVLPTPIHGTGIWGITALLTTYAYLYRVWKENREIASLVLTALVFMMLNILLGFKLRGIF